MNINAYQLTAAAAPAQGAPKARSANRTTVFLFGSRVRGDHRPDIDVDFAVFLDEWGSDNATLIVYWELRRRYGGSQMALSVRMMIAPEIDLICDYFENATTEHLETLGVDPTRLPSRSGWHERLLREFSLPVAERSVLHVTWLLDKQPIGFSMSDKIVFGERANMHLHMVKPEDRNRGMGVECVRHSVNIYFDALQLKRLFCEPNAFNIAPNRTLQKAGFKYVKTHRTVPSALTYHQAVTRWVVER
jgi:RimJ/RimL family protein N-acetyltransferase